MTEWIKCSDRMPEYFTEVLAVFIEAGNIPMQTVGYFSLLHQVTTGDTILVLFVDDGSNYIPADRVTHWMETPPLPEDVA